MSKQHIRYDVLSEPSPEYLAGTPGRNGIYTVVKLVDDLLPEIVKVFDGMGSAQLREDAYNYAHTLNYEIASPLMRQIMDEVKRK